MDPCPLVNHELTLLSTIGLRRPVLAGGSTKHLEHLLSKTIKASLRSSQPHERVNELRSDSVLLALTSLRKDSF